MRGKRGLTRKICKIEDEEDEIEDKEDEIEEEEDKIEDEEEELIDGKNENEEEEEDDMEVSSFTSEGKVQNPFYVSEGSNSDSSKVEENPFFHVSDSADLSMSSEVTQVFKSDITYQTILTTISIFKCPGLSRMP